MNQDGYNPELQSATPMTAADILMSQSLVGSYDLCAASVGQKTEPGYDLSPNQAMSWGSMIHAAIEIDLNLALDEPTRWSASQLRDLWDDSLLNERDGSWLLTELCGDEVLIRHWLDEAVVAMYKWQDNVYPTLDLADEFFVEETVSMQIGTLPNGRRVFFGGTGDLVEPSKHLVTDWKTAGRGWHQSKADFTGQVAAYLYLYEADFFRFVVFNRKSLAWETYDTTRTEAEIDAYLRHAFQVAKAIDADIYPVTNVQSNFGKFNRSWQCSAKWCGAWNICPFKYLADDKWEHQIADPREGWK